MNSPHLHRLLQDIRAKRRFDVGRYVNAKCLLLNEYFSKTGVSACVVGVSGGVDSAVVLGLLQMAARLPASPIKRIVCALMPMHIPQGTTNQSEATELGRLCIDALGGDAVVVDLSATHQQLKCAVDEALNYTGKPWASGQLVSNIRTPALYYLASLLSEQGNTAVVVGTTNRDEGSFIGYFGKAADGLVDLQLISDAHKSEVYSLATYLGVPSPIMQRAPTGDIYDGRTDEQLIGVSYDAIELYTALRAKGNFSEVIESLPLAAQTEFRFIEERLCTLNKQCAHKYIGGSVSAHLDVYQRAVPGGWRHDIEQEALQVHLSKSKQLNAAFNFSPEVSATIAQNQEQRVLIPKTVGDFAESALQIPSLLSAEECRILLRELQQKEWVAVGQNGMYRDFNPATDKVGSYRATTENVELARTIWERIETLLPPVRIFSENPDTDTCDDRVWRPVGVSPVLRFIRYENDGHLISHYDAPYEYWDGRKTLMSMVIYLNDASELDGGATRFIEDRQREVPFASRDFSDWNKQATDEQVLCSVTPTQGQALIFDHRLLHDGQALATGSQKIILRTDIIFERAGINPKPPVFKSQALGFKVAENTSSSGSKLTARMLAKIEEDPYYSKLWQRYSCPQKLKSAGFFDDGLEIGESYQGSNDVSFLSTPFHRILQNLADPRVAESCLERSPLVLLSTGGFGPVHKCHVQMMELAKSHLEAKGHVVVGGYLSPSHDDYVQGKSPGDMLDAHHRIHLCEQVIVDSPWLMVDPWEALYCKTAVNFTVVIERLRNYLAAHLNINHAVEIVYVYGSDNAGFSYTFLDRGMAVCVLRHGAEAEFNALLSDPDISNATQINTVNKAPAEFAVSSRLIREGAEAFMHEHAQVLFREWQNSVTRKSQKVAATLFLRNEELESVPRWMNSASETSSTRLAALEWFREQLVDILERSFIEAKGPSLKFDVDVDLLCLSEQKEKLKTFKFKAKVISLDPFLTGDYQLAVSRKFPIACSKIKPILVERPGHPTISQQISAIPRGSYTLLDDDIASGYTMEQVRMKVEPHIEVAETTAMIKLSEHVDDQRFPLDLVDLRDFLIGSHEGGLVVELPNGRNVRAPYVLPYVSPAERASTPLSANLQLSRSIWKLNQEFFRRLAGETLESADPSFRTLMNYIGFSDDTPLEDICKWHLQRLGSELN